MRIICMKKYLTSKSGVLILALVCCFLWGSAAPCIKIGYRLFHIEASDTASQIMFAGYRFVIAGLLALLIGSLSSKKLLLPKRGSMGKILALACFQTIIQYLFFYGGLAHASGVSSSIVNGSGNFLAILMATLIFRQEKLGIYKLTGCITGFAGVVLVSLAGGGSWGFAWNGEGFILMAALSYAVSSVLIKIFGRSEDPVVLSGYQFILGGVVMVLCGHFLGGSFRVETAAGTLLLAYMAFISAVAYSLWGLLLKYNPVSRVAIYGFSNPVFGVILSAILLDEGGRINAIVLLSLALVSAGIYLVNVYDASREK